MRKMVILSFIVSSFLQADSIKVEKILIEDSSKDSNKEAVKVSDSDIKFAKQTDLAQILSETLPEITLIRASGVGNDISLRGFKKDNINVLIDGAKVCGACPNRMDPPSMHISTSQIKEVEVREGAFDVANFGSLGGAINVITKEPTGDLGGEVSITGGSFGYKKGSVILNGGDEKIKATVGYSYESSEQYEDGDGLKMSEQVSKLAKMDGDKYINNNLDAYARENYWAKFVVELSENQQFKVSYLRDDASDVLYPAFGMDAQVDVTDMINAEYSIYELGKNWDKLSFQYYYSKVEHEMGTHFRKSGLTPLTFRTHAVDSSIFGAKVENRFNFDGFGVDVGVDGSKRNWHGNCINEPTNTMRQTRIPDVDTSNIAIFSKANKTISNVQISGGLRVDKTTIDASKDALKSQYTPMLAQNYYSGHEDKDFTNLSGNAKIKYNFNDSSNMFVAVGQTIRVPDAQEMYFINIAKDANNNMIWGRQGNPNLNETKNKEIDVGFETLIFDTNIQTTVFYSDLTDYIYAYKKGSNLTFQNIDASIYGFDIKSVTFLNNEFSLEGGIAYQRGQKDEALSGQNDKNLAEISPLKGRVAIKYDDYKYYGLIEFLASSEQKIDSDNGEIDIGGYSVLNLKAGMNITKDIQLNGGIENILDKTYAVNNSYVGRGLIASNSTLEPLVLNEPGRNFYINLNYSF